MYSFSIPYQHSARTTTCLNYIQLMFSMNGCFQVFLESVKRIQYIRLFLYCQQCWGAMVVIGHTNVDEGARELDAEQALAGSHGSWKNVVF